MSYCIETKGLTKKFNDFVAVDQLELNVPKGSIYGFLGPNGAGKTTTLKMLTGLIKPTQGEIWINGSQTKGNERVATIGYLPDVPGFYSWMSPIEYLDLAASLYGMSKDGKKNRIEEMLVNTGLHEVRNKKIKGFSRGMKQRLGLAQAIIHKPEIILLDEPVSALDPIGRKEIIEMIQALKSEATVFFSTHILADVERICDQVIMIHHGKKVLEGKMQDIKDKYATNAIYVSTTLSHTEELIQTLNTQSWVQSVVFELDELKSTQQSGNVIKVMAKDLELGKKMIPTIFSEHQWPIQSFQLAEPSLEEIFMSLL